jgi:hypothetical protein
LFQLWTVCTDGSFEEFDNVFYSHDGWLTRAYRLI